MEELLVAAAPNASSRWMPEPTSKAPRRHGLPFVRFGHELTLALRVCASATARSGAAGLRLLVAARVSRYPLEPGLCFTRTR